MSHKSYMINSACWRVALRTSDQQIPTCILEISFEASGCRVSAPLRLLGNMDNLRPPVHQRVRVFVRG